LARTIRYAATAIILRIDPRKSQARESPVSGAHCIKKILNVDIGVAEALEYRNPTIRLSESVVWMERAMSFDIKRTRQQVLEEESRLALRRTLPTEWIAQDATPDYGLDLHVTVVEGEAVTNNVFVAQLKATDRQVVGPDLFRCRWNAST